MSSSLRQDSVGSRENAERLRVLLEGVGGILWQADHHGILTAIAPGWTELTGQSEAELRHTGWQGMCHPHDGSLVANTWAASLRSGRNFEIESRLRKCDGSFARVHWLGVPVLDGRGQVREWIGTVTDVSERRESEELVLRMQRNELVGRLAGGIAHETNNQMTAVLGFTDFVLRGDNLTAEQRADLNQVRRAASRVVQLTRQLLAFSGRQVLQPEILDMDLTLRESYSLLTRTLGPEVRLHLDPGPGSKLVRVDRTQLNQILLNLTLNAREATTGDGPVTIGTRLGIPPLGAGLASSRHNGKAAVLLTVKDAGRGIDPSIRPHIFDPFFSTKPSGEASGLGLSVVKGIVDQSGGDVWVESAPGSGTTVTIMFPLVAAAEPGETGPSESPERFRGSTLLLVEDENAVRTVLQRGLAEIGHQVRVASDGPEALEVLEQLDGQVDLVVADLAMPRMSGAELAQMAAPRWPHLSFLYISGHPQMIAIQRQQLDPHSFFLQKPFSVEALAAAIRRILDHRPSRPGSSGGSWRSRAGTMVPLAIGQESPDQADRFPDGAPGAR
jgi:two-component system, cell cycle sensor histidine kinase and response regulator CckA